MNTRSVVVFHDAYSMRSSQYSNILQGIRTAAGRYATQVTTVTEDQLDSVNLKTLPRVCIAMGANMPFLQKVIDLLDEHGRHVLLAGCDSEPFDHVVSCVTPSRRSETQQLINYLYHCGRSRLALVGFGLNSINDTFRYHAAMTAVATWGDILKEENVYLWSHSPEDCFRAFLQRVDQYDAVVCPNDIITVCLINLLKENGIAVPENLFVASFGNSSVGLYHSPSITSMTMDLQTVGEQAFSGWRFLMNNDKAGEAALKISVPSRLIIRESTANMHSDRLFNLPLASSLEADPFYENETIAELVRIEKCISTCDDINLRMLCRLMDGCSYEQTADELFISSSTLRYRLNRIFEEIGVHSRQELERVLHRYLGEGNPFEGRLT